MNLFGLGYDIALHLYTLAILPKTLYRWHKYKNNIWKRFGKDFPYPQKKGRKLIWIHAVSLGETKAIAPLVKRFRSLDPAPLVILTTTTETGRAEGLKSAPEADFHLFLPLDFSYIMRRLVKRVAPDLVILTETDFWYHFQEAAQKSGASFVLVNGKISERSFQRLEKLPFLARRLLGSIDHFYLQGELYKKRFAELNIPTSKLTITGNIKLDAEVETIDTHAFKQQLGLTHETILTLGSTHHPEEQIWIEALKQLWLLFPHLKVILVPRHPERFNTVAQLLKSASVPFSRWSEGGTLEDCPLILMDEMGILKKCYQISDLTFVGGSFTSKVGGHNILEPALYGKPVLFGPHMHTQPDLLDLVNSYQAGLQITPDTLVPTLQKLLSNPSHLLQMGAQGLALTKASRGSLDYTFSLLQKQLS